MQLERQHLDFIDEYFRNDLGLSRISRNELMDHVCCMVESEMKEGVGFKNAFERVKTEFNFEKLNALDKELKFIHYSKLFNMKLIVLFIFFSATALPFFMNKESHSESVIESDPVTVLWENLIDPPSLWPVTNARKVSSSFGMRMHPISKEKKHHGGIDIPAKTGAIVVASSSGEIIKAEYHKGYGNHIIIKHDDQYSSLYGQLSKMLVEPGQQVKKGEIIGEVGSSGLSTAPHLHFEVIEDGKRKDPMKYIKA